MKRNLLLSILSLLLGSLLLLACTKANDTQTEAAGSTEPNDDASAAQTEPQAQPEASDNGFSFDGSDQNDHGHGGRHQGDGHGHGEHGSGNGQPPQGEPPQGGPGGNPPQGEPPQGGSGGNPPQGEPPQGGSGGPGGSVSTADITYTAANEITSADTQSGKTYESATADENALLIATNEAVTLENPTVSKAGDSNGGDACNFYGLNAAVLVKDGANVTITGGTIETAADGANGVFSYGGNGGRNGAAGDGTTVTISGTTITTTGDGSGGIMTTGGGTTYANDLTVTTSGRSSAPIRTDRGGGTVIVDRGTYVSNGLGSPAIYSTADVAVESATLLSNLSEGIVIEGRNTVRLSNCALTANNTQMNGNASFLDSIMLYQSMSGDADSGTSLFSMTGGALLSKSGHVFHVTNTNAVIELIAVAITNEDAGNVLLSVCGDGWSGAKNVAALNATRQTLSGTILVGSDSELTLALSDGSHFTGAISGAITNAKGETVSTDVGTVHVTIDASSMWTLTADTYISSFEGDVSSIDANGFSLYVNGEKIA